jgi:hypothetical protein
MYSGSICELVKCCTWRISLYGAEIWTLRKANHKYLESFEMWCCRRMGRISRVDRVQVEYCTGSRAKGFSYKKMKRNKANSIGHILRTNRRLKHSIKGKREGRIEVTRGRGRSRRQLLVGGKETREDWKLKEEALDRPMWRTRFGRGY